MKIFKGVNLSQLSSTEAKVGETIVCRSKENHNDFQIYIQRVEGVYTPMGKFVDLATAIRFAEKLETPTMVEHGYQILSLDHVQKMIIYYSTIEDEIEQYIENTEQLSDEAFQIGESGISVCFIVPKENVIERTNRLIEKSEMVHFGNYILSDYRRRLYASHLELGTESLDERLSEVSHADVEHFDVWRRSNDENVAIMPSYKGETIDRVLEMDTCSTMKKMCEESLSPEGMERFEKVIEELVNNRKGLKGN